MNSRPNPTAAIPQTSEQRELWATLRAYLEYAWTMIGAPAELARRLWLTRAEHRQIAGILRALEALLQRLIFLDALALTLEPEPPKPESKLRQRLSMSSASGAAFDMDCPEAWRAHFNLGLRLPGPRNASTRRTRRANITAMASAPLALRLEAIIRAFNDPAPLTRRLARRLLADARACASFIAPLSKSLARHPLAEPVRRVWKHCVAALRADTS